MFCVSCGNCYLTVPDKVFNVNYMQCQTMHTVIILCPVENYLGVMDMLK